MALSKKVAIGIVLVFGLSCGGQIAFDILVLPHSARGPQQLLLSILKTNVAWNGKK